jgi:hypothetical protein
MQPERDRPDEIEVTPAMIEAGVLCLFRHPNMPEPSEAGAAVIARDLFLAMAKKTPSSNPRLLSAVV